MKSIIHTYTPATLKAIRKCGCATSYTVTGVLDMTNRLYRRSKAAKALAKRTAFIPESGRCRGTFVSSAPFR